MTGRGFSVEIAETLVDALALIRTKPPRFGIIDLRLADGSGLDVIEAVRMRRDDSRLLILTGYGNIANAVTAVKLGAVDYLAKPADADAVFRALIGNEDVKADMPEHPMSAARVRWEHIQRIYELCERNVSETARQLDMHRRTLQRILSKHAPR
jgi:two-component system response regulator RegA